MRASIHLVTNILGRKVKNLDGEEVGVIQNMMIDPQSGMILYIILCYADFVGKMHRHFAIPNALVSVQKDGENSIFFEIEEPILYSARRLTDIDGQMNLNTSTKRVYEVDQDDPRFSDFHMYGKVGSG